MLKSERQRKILQLVKNDGSVRVKELSALFQVSEATIRRDLEGLARDNSIRRTHGGAVAEHTVAPEPPVVQRLEEQRAEKQRIGEAAAALVSDGDTVFVGSGTTTFHVAQNLVHMKNLTVITNAINVVGVLADRQDITVVMPGGVLRHSELSVIGHITEQVLRELRADKAFLGTRAISLEEGLTNEYLPEIMTDRAILQIAREVILVADHSKFGKVSTVLLSPLNVLDVIVTDPKTPAKMLEKLKERGIKVIVAS